ncbi:MAG: DUF1015 domain-containing protein [Dehalococcoidales bacterium]|nr:DUF1015 domain-containing protein [Dehalococcoidales bacterium]
MAEVRPFQGIRYNIRKITDLSGVICPPYDIISPRQQDALYQSSEYNFVRIEYNRETSSDNDRDNRYTRAAGTIREWLEQGILEYDAVPAFYLHDHNFAWAGKNYIRRDIIVRLRLEEWDKNIIRPHENIIPRAKSDRMSMLRSCRCNTSQVLAMYQDPEKIICSILTEAEKEAPAFDFSDSLGDRHQLWPVSGPESVRQIQNVILQQPLYIADGHHRYDSALTYRREISSQSESIAGNEGFNFVMTSLIDFADPGMVILPTHRLIRGLPGPSLDRLRSGLAEYFDIEGLALDAPHIWDKVDSLLSGLTPEMRQVRLAVLGLDPGCLSMLTLKNFDLVDRLMPGTHSALYKKLDVSLVDHVILDNILAFDEDKEEGSILYSHDRQEVIDLIKERQYQLAFILNPVRPEIIRAIADAGDRMPRKSTYFYPKTPAGLVFYKL